MSLVFAYLLMLYAQPGDVVCAPRPDFPAEVRAVRFLEREVPRWRRENGCYSCHNNGDAARVLYRAADHGFALDRTALQDTTDWLSQPERWQNNAGDERFQDRTLAAIQFAAALEAATSAGFVDDNEPLRAAARQLATLQQTDGRWKIEGADGIASPTTYGPFLIASGCRRGLAAANQPEFSRAIVRIDAFLRRELPRTVPDAAGCLMGLEAARDEEAVRQRRHCLQLLQRAEAASGGWGPYANAPLEPFDTAVAVIALDQLPEAFQTEQLRTMLARGRRYLVASQLPDGSWPETTRPPDGNSYAQRMSTTAWAALALMETRDRAAGTVRVDHAGESGKHTRLKRRQPDSTVETTSDQPMCK